MADADFAQRMFSRVLADTHHNQRGAQQDWGMVRPLSARRRSGDALERLAGRVGLARRHFDPDAAGQTLARIAALSEGLARTEELLADEASRSLLLDVIAVRILGDNHARLPVAQSEFRAACARIDRDQREEAGVEKSADGAALHRYRIEARNGPVVMIGAAFQIQEFFGVEQYALRRDGVVVAPEPGDVVIDGGGGWGDTALYFADAVGPDGQVFSFEFVPDNLRLFEINRALNPRLSDRMQVVPHPLWSSSDERLRYGAAGGQTSVAAPVSDEAEATTISIDSLCAEHTIENVDFVKLDIEGAELAALRGAEQAIRRCRPKLALSIYHHDRDLAEIPAWVAGLDLGYRLYLGHTWPGAAETILFGQPA